MFCSKKPLFGSSSSWIHQIQHPPRQSIRCWAIGRISSNPPTTSTPRRQFLTHLHRRTAGANRQLGTDIRMSMKSPFYKHHHHQHNNNYYISNNHITRYSIIGRRWQSSETIPEPSYATLRLVAFTQAIPFIGFGFMDNAILIIAGDAIDASLGIWFGMSTLCAAAIGNIISDLAGIGLGTVIEDFCSKVLKLPVPDITASQRTLRSVRNASNLGMAFGMTLGCILGMFPLLFIDTSKHEHMKKRAHLESLFKDVVTEAKTLIGAESTCLYLRVNMEDPQQSNKSNNNKGGGGSTIPSTFQRANAGKSGNFLYSTPSNSQQQFRPAVDGEHLFAMYYVLPGGASASNSGSTTTTSAAAADGSGVGNASSLSSAITSDDTRVLPIGKGIVSRAILTGEAWNIPDVRSEPDYLPDFYEKDGSIPAFLKHMIVVPVLDGQGKAIAVIRGLNKVQDPNDNNNNGKGGFTDSDVQVLKSLASHISVSLQSFFRDEEDEEMRLRDTIRILKEHGLEGIANSSSYNGLGTGGIKRHPSLFPDVESSPAGKTT